MREVDPSQPLTTGIWQNVEKGDFTSLQKQQLDSSDVLSFHNYKDIEVFAQCVQAVKSHDAGRPVLCTEYMARTLDSTFEPHLQLMRNEQVDAMNWGLVAGKTQTIFAYTTNTQPDTQPPAVWFYDIFKEDGTPYSDEEVRYIRGVMQKQLQGQ